MTHKDQVTRLLGATKSIVDALILYGGLHESWSELRIKDARSLISEIEAELSAESVGLSPTNAYTTCIRAAKRVIAALNLPEGAGVAWNPILREWHIWTIEPVSHRATWLYDDSAEVFPLPDTAIPPWPGDFRESWITMSTEEV